MTGTNMLEPGFNEKEPLIPKQLSAAEPNIDRGFAWAILFASSLCYLIIFGMPSAVGIFYVDIQDMLDVSIVDVSFIGAFLNFSMFSGVILTSPLTNRFGCRTLAILGALTSCVSFIVCSIWTSLYTLYAFLGIIQGLGMALTISPSVMMINKYFKRRRPMGLVFISAASSLGIVCCNPLLSFLLERYTLQGAFLISAGICLQVVVAAMLFFPLRQDKPANGTVTDSPEAATFSIYFDKTLWKNCLHYMMLISTFMYGFGTFIPLTLLPEYMVAHGISMDTAALSLSTFGASTTLSRLIVCAISNTFPRSNQWTYISTGIAAGVPLFIIPLCQTGTQYLVTTTLFGLPYGAISSLMPVLLVELFGSEKLPACFGMNTLAMGIGSLIGSPVAGFLAETIPVVGIEFIVSGIASVLSGIVLIPAIWNDIKCIKSYSSY